MYKYDKGQITIAGWEKGVAPSPHEGIGDLKNVNITSIKGEASVNYERVRVDNPVATGSMTANSISTPQQFTTAVPLPNGTWIKVTSLTGLAGLTVGDYYYASTNPNFPTLATLYTDLGTTSVVITTTGTLTFETLTMGTAIDWVAFNNSDGTYKYYILDLNGVIWRGEELNIQGVTPRLDSSIPWIAITPHGSEAGVQTGIQGNIENGSLTIMGLYMIVFTDSQVLQLSIATTVSDTGVDMPVWQSIGADVVPHSSIAGVDNVVYFTNGANIGVFYEVAGQTFDPTNNATYVYTNSQYILPPWDTATALSQIPTGNSIALVVGGRGNNIYTYPDVQSSTSAKPTSVLWIPEARTKNLVQANNYIFIFSGSKGNIYITNGTTIAPIGTMPDYIAGSKNYVQDPYYQWGDAMYLRGRLFFSITDHSPTHKGNIGGVWSFVPTFSYFINQDAGLALRLENVSAEYGLYGYDQVATVLFAGLGETAQHADGPQYMACWTPSGRWTPSTAYSINQEIIPPTSLQNFFAYKCTTAGTSGLGIPLSSSDTIGQTITDGTAVWTVVHSIQSIDFSSDVPYSNGEALIETDVIPVGTFLDKKTFTQVEYKLASALTTGESVQINYRTDLEQPFVSAGTISTEPNTVSGIIQGVNFQKAQILQLQVILTSTATSPSYCRLQEIYIR